MNAASFRRRSVLAIALLALAFATAAGAAVNGASAGWYSAPKRIVQGNPMKVEVTVPRGTKCSLSFTYKGGAKQKGLGSRSAGSGKASWEWNVPKKAPPGPARARLVCSGRRAAFFSVMIIGEVIPATIEVVKQGFSIRPKRFGNGADSSWGVILKNTSPQSDAFDVVVLANYVMPDNKLIGSASVRVGRIARGMEYAVGGDLTFPGVPPVVRLEIVVQIGKSSRLPMTFPGVANIRIVNDRIDPAVVGSVEGEVVNDNAQKTMERSALGTVVLDAAGNILGGESGSAFQSLPPGSRVFFKISGMRAVDFGRATSAIVSVTPSYRGDPRP